MPVLTRSQRKRKLEEEQKDNDDTEPPVKKRRTDTGAKQDKNKLRAPTKPAKDKKSDKIENDSDEELPTDSNENKSEESTNDPFQSFIEQLKDSYTRPQCETHEQEMEMWESHNKFEEQLFIAAQHIQASNTLSLNEKFIKLKKIATIIDEYFQNLVGDYDDIPDELITNNDGSLIMESVLKKHRPSDEKLFDIIYRFHSGRLNPRNPMHVVLFTMTSSVSMGYFNEMLQAYAMACKFVDVKFGMFGNEDEIEDKNEEDNTKNEIIKAETKQIIQFIKEQIYGINVTENNRPDDCSRNVRFDSSYTVRKYFMNKLFENVYCGKLKWEQGYSVGSDFVIDCAGDLFAVCGGNGWKYRDPALTNYYIDPKSSNMKVLSGGNLGFSSPGYVLYCDALHSRFWNSGDHRVKCSQMIENGKYKSNELSCEYILDTSSITGNNKRLFTTKDCVFIYSCSTGKFYQWQLNHLKTHKQDYYVEYDDDDDVPELDENGIATEQHSIMENTWSDLEFVSVEVSGGQKYEKVFDVQGKSGNHSAISGDFENGNVNNVFISDNNMIYLYDMNKQNINGIFLGHNTNVLMGFRQYLLDQHMLISYDCSIAKIWDIRTCLPEISIKGTGSYRMNCCIGFNICNNPFIACGGVDECVTIWDIRKVNNKNNNALYEITTGNNTVEQIIWHEKSKTLFVSTDCSYIDRLGRKYYGMNNQMTDVIFGGSDNDENDWPSDAKHHKKDFPSQYDAGMNEVYRYTFK